MSYHHSPIKPNNYILSQIDKFFRFNPDTGELQRFDRNHKAWRLIDSTRENQVGFRIGSKIYKFCIHHISWHLYYGEWPISEIDHINRNPSDNKIKNLRLSNRGQQILNSSKRSGRYLPGVSKARNRFQARIKATYNSANIHLGMFGTEIEAHEAYRRAYREKFGVELNYPYLEWRQPQVTEEIVFDCL